MFLFCLLFYTWLYHYSCFSSVPSPKFLFQILSLLVFFFLSVGIILSPCSLLFCYLIIFGLYFHKNTLKGCNIIYWCKNLQMFWRNLPFSSSVRYFLKMGQWVGPQCQEVATWLCCIVFQNTVFVLVTAVKISSQIFFQILLLFLWEIIGNT